MANFWKVNQTSSNTSIRLWDLVAVLQLAGWTLPLSSDGSTGNPVTHGGTGVGGFDRNGAWLVVRAPDGGREFLFHRHASWGSTYIGIRESRSAGFVGGSGVTPPTAPDQIIYKVDSQEPFASGSCRHHCWASDVAPYCFYICGYSVAGSVSRFILMLEELDPIGGDSDNTIFIKQFQSAGNVYASSVNIVAYDSNDLSFFGRTTSLTTHSLLAFHYKAGANSGFDNNQVPTGLDGKDLSCPALMVRPLTHSEPMTKGFTKNYLVNGTLRASGDTYSVHASRDRIYILTGLSVAGSYSLPWNGDAPLV